jgi:hypothetical protein
MTRKDYVILAKAIHTAFRQSQSEGEILMVTAVAKEIASALQEDNPAFKYERFLKACGVLE